MYGHMDDGTKVHNNSGLYIRVQVQDLGFKHPFMDRVPGCQDWTPLLKNGSQTKKVF